MASSIADNNPSPPSPRRAGPKHSGRRMRSLTTTLAFSSTLSPNKQTREERWSGQTFCRFCGLGRLERSTGFLLSYHCRRRQSVESQGSVHPPRGSSQCRGILCSPASRSSEARSQPDTAPPVGRRMSIEWGFSLSDEASSRLIKSFVEGFIDLFFFFLCYLAGSRWPSGT